MLNPEVDISFAPVAASAPRPNKQKLVKHKRKNWKKTDISEIEQGYEDLIQQRRSGGARADKKDDELFFINKTKLSLNEDGEPIVQKRKRMTLEEKMNNLHCYKNLKPDPNSFPVHDVRQLTKPDVNSKRQATLMEKRAKKMQRLLGAKCRQNTYCAKLAAELAGKIEEKIEDIVIPKRKKSNFLTTEFKENFTEKKKNVQIANEFDKDIWSTRMATDGTDLPEVTQTNEFYLKGLKKIPFTRPKNPIYKESKIAHVEPPHPGHSYNPDYEDHQALLLEAHTIELKKLQEEQKLMRRLAKNAKKMSWSEMEKRWLDEMSVADLFEPKADTEEESEVETEGTTKEETLSKRELRRRTEAIHIGRKADTRAKRTAKKLLAKIKLREAENKKAIRLQQNEIYRLKSLKKEVNAKLAKVEENTKKNLEEEEKRHAIGQKRLGRVKFEDQELELKLSEEITGNLRTLKPEGNIMRDRYISFQKRNIIEPREKAKGKDKYAKKKFQKRNAHEVTHFIDLPQQNRPKKN